MSIYVKGYGTPPARDQVKIDYHTHSVEVSLPPLDGVEAKSFKLEPLAGAIAPGECSERVLGTKVRQGVHQLWLTTDRAQAEEGRADSVALSPGVVFWCTGKTR